MNDPNQLPAVDPAQVHAPSAVAAIFAMASTALPEVLQLVALCIALGSLYIAAVRLSWDWRARKDRRDGVDRRRTSLRWPPGLDRRVGDRRAGHDRRQGPVEAPEAGHTEARP